MSLLFCDGFDHYVTADLLKKWTRGFGNILNNVGRRGSAAWYGSLNTHETGKAFTPKTTLIVGMAANFGGTGGAVPAASTSFLTFSDPATQLMLHLNDDLSISAYRGAGVTLLGTSAPNVVTLATYHYIECRVVFDQVAGAVEVRVNGATVLNLSAIDTCQTANAYASQVVIRNFGAFNTYYDDLYICDGAGVQNNTFLGDIRIDTLRPNYDGNYNEFTPTPVGNHWDTVDEPTIDTANYVATTIPGAKESFQYTDIEAVTGTIKAVQVSSAFSKDDAGTRLVANLVRSGASEAAGQTAGLPTSSVPVMVTSVHEVDPATGGAWSLVSVNNAEFGVVVVQ